MQVITYKITEDGLELPAFLLLPALTLPLTCSSTLLGAEPVVSHKTGKLSTN